jgi:hypothetical protein
MLQYLQEQFDDFNEVLVKWYLGMDESPIHDLNAVATKVRKGAMLDMALSSVGFDAESVRDLRPTVKVLKDIGFKIEMALHIWSFGIGFGAEYWIDRRKNFSFTKATMYYCGMYGFTSAVLQQRAIMASINMADDALNSFA